MHMKVIIPLVRRSRIYTATFGLELTKLSNKKHLSMQIEGDYICHFKDRY